VYSVVHSILEDGFKCYFYNFVRIPENIARRLQKQSGWTIVSLSPVFNPGTEMWSQWSGLFLSVQCL